LQTHTEVIATQALYAITGVLVAPFTGLCGTPQIATGAALELSTKQTRVGQRHGEIDSDQ
jgi:hypothetical protein